MVAQASDLVAIRDALLSIFAASASSLGVLVTYQALPQGKPWPIGQTVVRASMRLPSRLLLGAESEPCVQQDGLLTLQWLFPRGTGMAQVALAIDDTVALYGPQTLDGGITITGDATASRVGVESDRVRWDVSIPWRTQRVEPAAGDDDPMLGLVLPTTAQALAAVRNVWAARIEQAVVADAWPGLRTFYDDVGPFQTPPVIPWAGYWCEAFASVAPNIGSTTEMVLGRSLVHLHTDRDVGTAGADHMVERIIAEHNRTSRSITLGIVQPVGARVSPAGTWQTTLRVPFRFERLRPTN